MGGSSVQKPIKKKRRTNYSLYVSLVLLVVIAAFAVLSTTVLFKIESIVITGDSVYTTDEILAASGIKGGDNLLRTNMSKCRDRITGELVYIETAEVKRVFPATVSIKVTACKQTVNVVAKDNCFVLSRYGKVLEIQDKPIKNILTITGAVPAENTVISKKFECDDKNKTEIFYRLVDVYINNLDGKINSFDMTDYLNISCVYDNRINIEFGAASDLDYKLKLAADILSQKISPTSEGTLKMLSSGASFIDKDGLEQNEQVYESNMITSSETSAAESEPSNTDNSSENSSETTVAATETEAQSNVME